METPRLPLTCMGPGACSPVFLKTIVRWILACMCYLLAEVFLPGLIAQDIFSEEVLKIEISFDREDWREELTMAKQSDDKRRLKAVVQMNKSSYEDVQVRFKGNSSFHGALKAGYRKIPLNLRASEDQLFAGGYETLKLGNNFRDPSAVRELLAYRIASEYVPVPLCTYAAVTINGEFQGLFTATEGINRKMTRRFFCDQKRGLVQCEPDLNAPQEKRCPRSSYANLAYLGEDKRCYEKLYVVKSDDEWAHLMRLTRVLQDSSERIDQFLDVHLALWMHAINNILVNLDSYLGYFCHNYYLYRDPENVYHPLIWDLNLAFGGFTTLKPGDEIDLATLSPVVHDKPGIAPRPLITGLLKDRTWRRIYLSMIRTILDEWFLNDRYLVEATRLQKIARPYFEKERGNFFSLEDFDQGLTSAVKKTGPTIPGIVTLMEERMDYLDKHPLLGRNHLRVESVNVESPGDRFHLSVTCQGGVTGARCWYRTTGCGPFRKVAMTQVADQVFQVQLETRPVDYYFELEGEDAAQLWPAHAPMSTLR